MTIAPLILIVDDDPAIRESLERELLDAGGYTTVSASDGLEGVRTFESHSPDLILTDLSMPRSDGFELISTVRAKGRTPIIVLSVRGDDADKIRALDLGADDFVTKPFSVAELLARVRAQLRRIAPTATMLRFNDLQINLDHRRVTQGERDVHLTPTEYALLELLATHAGKPVFTDYIIARVWRDAPGTTSDTVRVHMSALRKKIEPDPSSPRYIVTEPWVGYRFIAEPV
ncbi:MAG TPA: response regulator transcription factor [Thermoanaerobaculia bacterium]|nr:response regulator transcription factor [Thermoanaerobaculia bacterium]